MEHDHRCPTVGEHSDAARRVADSVNIHVAAKGWDAVKRWVAIALEDGKSDGTLYDTKAEAIRGQRDHRWYFYVSVPPNGTNACKAESLLRFARMSAKAQASISDRVATHGDPLQLITRIDARQQNAMSARLIRPRLALPRGPR